MISIKNKKLEQGLTNIVGNPTLDFWGEFALYINFRENNQMPTAGVTVKNNKMWFYYNEEFINKLTDKELCFLILHEIFHLVRNHTDRAQSLTKHRVANVAMDMLINDAIDESYKAEADLIENCYTTPEEYEGARIFEPLYEWLNDKKKERDEDRKQQKQEQSCEGDGEGEGGSAEQQDSDGGQQGQGKSGGGDEEEKKDGEGSDGEQEDNTEYDEDGKDKNGNSKKLNKVLDSLDEYEFDVHMDSDVPDEVRNQMVKDILEGIKRKRGTVAGDIEKILENFQKHKKNYLRQIQMACNYVKGGKKKNTIKRPSRRGVVGLKGRERTGNIINVLLDVSGSMIGEFEKTIGILFRDGYKLNIIMCDTEVKSHTQISDKHELKKLKIVGLGGTVLQPGIEYIKENLPKYNTCVITDGYTDNLDFTGIKKSVFVTTDVVPQLIGNVKVVKIDG